MSFQPWPPPPGGRAKRRASGRRNRASTGDQVLRLLGSLGVLAGRAGSAERAPDKPGAPHGQVEEHRRPRSDLVGWRAGARGNQQR